MWKKHAQTQRASKNAENFLSKKENKTITYHASNCEYKSGERTRRPKQKKQKKKRLQRSAGVEEEEKKRPRVAESRREQKRSQNVRVQPLQREQTNILITRVKEPNNLLTSTISDSLINYTTMTR